MIPAAYAWDSTADSNINTIYETNTADFIVTVANILDNTESINNVSIDALGFDVNSAEESSGWQNSMLSPLMNWNIFIPGFEWFTWISYLNLGISSDAQQNFRFNAKALKVDNDTTYDWPVTSVFHDDTGDVQYVQVTVLNDYTGPVLLNWTPEDGDFIKENTTDLLASVNATDPQTGVAQVFFNYIDCDNTTPKVSINLTGNWDIYSDTADVSDYPDSTEVCFTFFAENNGGAYSNETGRFTIDGRAPVVFLVSPEDDAIMNALSEFVFNADDNLAPTMECDLFSDGAVYATVTALDEIDTSVNASSMPEGKHNWSVACTDLAGWTGYSDEERVYTLDRTPPNITLNTPGDGDIVAAGILVNITVYDEVGVDTVSYTVDNSMGSATVDPANETILFNTSDWPDGDTIITVDAVDLAGNPTHKVFMITVDRTPPAVNLVSPLDNSSIDYHVDFTFDAVDTYDPLVDCDLYVDGSVLDSIAVQKNDSTAVIQRIVDLGNHQWRVRCIDDAGNIGTSPQTWNFTALDLTGPDITVQDSVVARGDTAKLNVTLYDISGIDDSSVYANVTSPSGITVTIPLSEDNGYYTGDFITSLSSELGDYDVTVYAEDKIGNSNTGSGNLEVTYAYIVHLNANPNPAVVNEQVTLTGSVRFDNGSLVPDEFITLIMPDQDYQISIDPATGSFTQVVSFDAAGDYDVTATITPDNGFTFSDTETIDVDSDSGNNNDGGDNGGGGDDGGDNGGSDDDGHSSGGEIFAECGDGTRDAGENCLTCPEDAGCSNGFECSAGVCQLVINEDLNDENECGDNTDFLTDSENCGLCGKQCPVGQVCSNGECKKDKECSKDSECGKGRKCNNGKCIGQNKGLFGRATGFLNLDMIKSSIFWWVVLMLLAIFFVLLYMKKKGLPGVKEDEIGLEEYLNRKH